MDIRKDAHRLLDELDEDQVTTAAELLRDLVRQRRPLDDEPAASSGRQHAAAIEDGLALLLSGDLDHPTETLRGTDLPARHQRVE